MQVGDVIQMNPYNTTDVKSFDSNGKYTRCSFPLNQFNKRVVKEIKGDFFIMRGDNHTWFLISDFETEPQYEIY